MSGYEILRKYIKKYIPSEEKKPIEHLAALTGYSEKQIKRILSQNKNERPSLKICMIFMTALKMTAYDGLEMVIWAGYTVAELESYKHFNLINCEGLRDQILDDYVSNSNNISPKDFFKGI